ncbi:hypothetical protein RESH_04566 [Rhodopirellula europaea SH398]|uniref:TIR domain-containing protein n=1 Tax=Rhodopirellula europaea SH398 TaxID=1263868 RepID=M5RZY5_9BACT|nr:hypothetical protein RESH_04566 [Rhodopirellula europaea SH398]
MHPNTFRANLLRHDLRDEVFVIMSFAPDFHARWEDVIQPSIRDAGLEPVRVDYNDSGESIVHDIIDGIAHARLVVADITSTRMVDESGAWWPQRNGNVMWEVGIAHTLRLPDEVVMVRSDSDRSIFDLTQFRAFTYDPAAIEESKEWLTAIVCDRIRSVDQSKSILVAQAVRSIDALGIHFLFSSVPADGRDFLIKPNMANGLNTPRLFDLGIIEVSRLEIVPQSDDCPNGRLFHYRLTDFGKLVLEALLEHVGMDQGIIARVMGSSA